MLFERGSRWQTVVSQGLMNEKETNRFMAYEETDINHLFLLCRILTNCEYQVTEY